jgi:hypothetical protein
VVLLQAKLEVHNIKAALLRKSLIVHKKMPRVKPVKEVEIMRSKTGRNNLWDEEFSHYRIQRKEEIFFGLYVC